MRGIADTEFLVAFANRNDRHHQWAVGVAEQVSEPLLKVIPLSEAKAHLSEYAHRCHDEPVVVTVNGRPAFQLVPLKKDDDLIDRLVKHHPGFRRLLQRRLASGVSRRLTLRAGSCHAGRPGRARAPEGAFLMTT